MSCVGVLGASAQEGLSLAFLALMMFAVLLSPAVPPVGFWDGFIPSALCVGEICCRLRVIQCLGVSPPSLPETVIVIAIIVVPGLRPFYSNADVFARCDLV